VTAASGIVLDAALIVGFGAAGRATTRALRARGLHPVVIDDKPTEAVLGLALGMGVELIVAPDEGELTRLVESSSVVLPSPGVGDHHVVFEMARTAGVPVAGEFDLARLWDSRPIVAITGTNGKTTVTTIVTDALNRSGIKAVAAGNTDVPLVEAIDDDSVDTFVVEASSFRLEHAQQFSPSVAGWLNFAPDHLDAHSSLDAYRAAKAKIWGAMGEGGVVVANAEDDVVLTSARSTGCDLVTFGLETGTWHWEQGSLVGPDGPILSANDLQHKRPHDLANAAAVSALASAGGASVAGIVDALKSYVGLPHRVELIASHDGVLWVNDSKATVPQATLAAVGGYESIVLIAGGRNKGLPMDSLREIVPNVHSVIAMGDAASEVAQAVEGLVKVDVVPDLEAAVARARAIARPGDVVLLSPACTSYDQYASYVDRGEHFRRLVQEMLQ
jgi:UDP-N-acetylmuramoylalanine--D-glutamate ligase